MKALAMIRSNGIINDKQSLRVDVFCTDRRTNGQMDDRRFLYFQRGATHNGQKNIQLTILGSCN